MKRKIFTLGILVITFLLSCSKNARVDDFEFYDSLGLRNSVNIGELHNEFVRKIMPTFENQNPDFSLVNERIIKTGINMGVFLPQNYKNNSLLDSLFYKSNIYEDSVNAVHFFHILDKALDSLVNMDIINISIRNYLRNSVNDIYHGRDYNFERMKIEASNLCVNEFERIFILNCYSIGQNSYDLWNVPENEIAAIGHIVAADLVGGVLGGLFGAAEAHIRQKHYTVEDAAWNILIGAASSSVGAGLFKLAKYVMK